MRDGVVHALVREHFAAFAEQVQEGGRSLSRYVVAEFEAFVRCGVLACGFMRARCAGCRHDRLVAFSCQGSVPGSAANARGSGYYGQWVLCKPERIRADDGAALVRLSPRAWPLGSSLSNQ